MVVHCLYLTEALFRHGRGCHGRLSNAKAPKTFHGGLLSARIHSPTGVDERVSPKMWPEHHCLKLDGRRLKTSPPPPFPFRNLFFNDCLPFQILHAETHLWQLHRTTLKAGIFMYCDQLAMQCKPVSLDSKLRSLLSSAIPQTLQTYVLATHSCCLKQF